MQYRTTCNNCGREYMVDGNPGETIHAKCPYCGALANVVTPTDYQGNSYQTAPMNSAISTSTSDSLHTMHEKRKSRKPLFLRVTMWFLIIITILFVVMTILYLIFTGMSK